MNTSTYNEGKSAIPPFIPLGIAMDYRVNWSIHRIIRDFVQNFYDSVGSAHFNKEFQYNWEVLNREAASPYCTCEGDSIHIRMRSNGHTFSYEWLSHIGGSTKTGKDGYAGEYGEGFKIALLCLFKSGGNAVMSSGGWTLFPDEYMEEIDGQRIPMFGYRMEEREEDGFTTLDLYGIPVSEENVRYAREALLEFFYPENPLFGNEIESTDGYALYERSDLAVPCADAADIPGVLYYKYIARGRLPFPAVIHLTEKADRFESDRSRELLYDADIIEAVYKLTENLSPDASLWLLIRMEKYWNETPKFRKGHVADLHTWYYVICQLVRNVSVSGELVSLFVLKYPPGKYAYVERIGNDGERKRLIRESRSWFNEQNKGGRRRRLVNPIFRLFGIASVLDEYTEKKGMLYREPDGEEKSRSEMLKACAGVILSGWIPNAYMPEILIDTGSGVKGGSRSAYGGHEASFRTETRMERASSFEKRKYHIKYHVKTIVLEADDLSVHTTFQKTLLKYVDGCVRMYGMERSARSNAVLTYTGSLLYQARNVIAAYANRWNQVISEEIHGNESGE